jgi:hypothetical protein
MEGPRCTFREVQNNIELNLLVHLLSSSLFGMDLKIVQQSGRKTNRGPMPFSFGWKRIYGNNVH